MSDSGPQYLLFSQSIDESDPGRWRFMLRSVDGSQRIVAEDTEPSIRGERLELLTVVRGLEALDQPSRVTVVTSSTYVRKGFQYGLDQWRENGWRWERFGEMVPVKNNDLWQRLDRAMWFHQLECRTLRFDSPHASTPHPCDLDRRQSAPKIAPIRRSISPQTVWNWKQMVALSGRILGCVSRWIKRRWETKPLSPCSTSG